MTVWTELTHEAIFNAVEKAAGTKLANVLRQRNSYINRVYELEEHDSRERLIAKFYRPGRWSDAMIREEHAFLKELAGKEVPVIPPLEFNGETLFHWALSPTPYSLKKAAARSTSSTRKAGKRSAA